jgi:3-keto-disaccharide hydrolase
MFGEKSMRSIKNLVTETLVVVVFFSISGEANVQAHNTLSTAEQAAGWTLLYDGQTASGWRSYGKQTFPSGRWKTANGELELVPIGTGRHSRADIITAEQFENFELTLDWKISENGNSGIFYHVVEAKKYKKVSKTGIEMQILDNERHEDSIPKHRAGDLYDMIASSQLMSKSAGQWNHAKLIVNNRQVQHWLNGVKIVEYSLGNNAWDSLVAGSKFKKISGFWQSK